MLETECDSDNRIIPYWNLYMGGIWDHYHLRHDWTGFWNMGKSLKETVGLMLVLRWEIFGPQAASWYKALNNSVWFFGGKTLLAILFFLYVPRLFLCVLEWTKH